jgi:hypothetical protein
VLQVSALNASSITFSTLSTAELRGTGVTMTAAPPDWLLQPTASTSSQSSALVPTDCDTGQQLPSSAWQSTSTVVPAWYVTSQQELVAGVMRAAGATTGTTPTGTLAPLLGLLADLVAPSVLPGLGLEIMGPLQITGT